MRTYIQRFLVVFVVALLSACGGGGGGGGGGSSSASTSVSLDKRSVTVQAYPGESQSLTVSVSYTGQGVLVGPPKGQVMPGWLTVGSGNGQNGFATFPVYITAPDSPGTYSGTLRFVTARDNDVNSLTWQDLPVTVHVEDPLDVVAVSGQPDLPQGMIINSVPASDVDQYTVQVEYRDQQNNWLEIRKTANGFIAQPTTTRLDTGSYSAKVTFSRGGVAQKSVFIVYRLAEPSITMPVVEAVRLDNQSPVSALSLRKQITMDSESITWRLAGFSPLLKVTPTGNELSIDIQEEKLKELENGTHKLWFEIAHQTAGSNYENTERVEFDLVLDFKRVTNVVPDVLYLGEQNKIRLYGNGLGNLAQAELLALSPEFTSATKISANEVEVVFNHDVAGEYQFGFDSVIPVKDGMVKLLVRSKPEFVTGSVDLPGYVIGPVILDPKRDVLYINSNQKLKKLSQQNGKWHVSSLSDDNIRSLGLSSDGDSLLTGDESCQFKRYDLASKQWDVMTNPSCHYHTYGFVGQLYSGDTLVVNTDQWPTAYTVPGWAESDIKFYWLYSPIAILNQYGTHMIWAQSNTITGTHKAYLYSAVDKSFLQFNTSDSDYFDYDLFSMSANGNRIAYHDAIYDQNLRLIGHLAGGVKENYHRTGISPDGKLAARFDRNSNVIELFDITSETGQFIKSAKSITVGKPKAHYIQHMLFSEDNRYLFVFVANYIGGDLVQFFEYEMKVVDLSAL